ncbi:unnamed protein product, partial [Phaeothamnion confervicola]
MDRYASSARRILGIQAHTMSVTCCNLLGNGFGAWRHGAVAVGGRIPVPKHEQLFARIEQLFDVGAMADVRVFVAGCGSGGSAVALQLAMSGIRKFTLTDNDTVDVENVIRHVCGLRYLGRRKVLAVQDVLEDRNPQVEVE